MYASTPCNNVILHPQSGITPVYLVKSLFPIVFNRYWFVSAYFILYLLGLPLYKGLRLCSRNEILIVIVALLINNTFLYPANMTLLQGVLAYIIGYYLKEYEPFKNWNRWQVAFSFAIALGCYTIERILVRALGIEHSVLDEGLRYVFLLLMAVMFFSFFEKLQYKKEWPTKVSKNVLAVYLISACPAIVELLYEDLLPIESMVHEWWFILYYFVVNILIFIVCVVADIFVSRLNNYQTEFWIYIWNRVTSRFSRASK